MEQSIGKFFLTSTIWQQIRIKPTGIHLVTAWSMLGVVIRINGVLKIAMWYLKIGDMYADFINRCVLHYIYISNFQFNLFHFNGLQSIYLFWMSHGWPWRTMSTVYNSTWRWWIARCRCRFSSPSVSLHFLEQSSRSTIPKEMVEVLDYILFK